MKIQKVFNNIENKEEKLYSISMTQDEIALFSEFQKEFGWIRNKLPKDISKEEQKMGYAFDDIETNPRIINPDMESKMI